MVKIDSWSLKTGPDGLQRLEGCIYGHPDFRDGVAITTPGLQEINIAGKHARTYNGTMYTLGHVDPRYRAEAIAQGWTDQWTGQDTQEAA